MNKVMLALLLVFCVNAQAEVNKWVDESGRVHYSDQPPPASANVKKLGPAAKTRDSTESGDAAESDNNGEPKSIAEREAELRKKQKAEKEAAAKAAKEQANKQANQDNCNQAKLSLKTLQSGIRIKELDANGEQVYIDDEERQQRIAKTQEDIEKLCK